MRCPFWLLLVVLALGRCADNSSDSSPKGGGAATAGGTQSVSPRDPRVEFELRPKTIDLGLLTATEIREGFFEVVNTGAVALRSLNIRPDCGCLQFEYAKTELAAGETRKVKYMLGAGREQQKSIGAEVILSFNRPYSRVVNFLYFGMPTLQVQPRSVRFGRTEMSDKPQSVTLVVKVRVPSETPESPLTAVVEGGAGSVHAEASEVQSEPIGGMVERSATVVCTLDRSKVLGELGGQLVLTSAWSAETRLSITGQIHNGAYLDSNSVHFGKVRKGRSKTREVRLFYTRVDAPVIEAVRSDHAAFVGSTRADEGSGSIVVEVEYTPSAEATGEERGTLEVVIAGEPEPLRLEVAGRSR